MLILNDPALVNRISDPDIRDLVQQQFSEICDGAPYDYNLYGYMIVVEPGGSVEVLEEEISSPILRNLFDDTRYEEPDFTPSFEILEDHGNCYEIVFIFNDKGTGITIFIPKQPGIDADLPVCVQNVHYRQRS